jgi:hypothetical protein
MAFGFHEQRLRARRRGRIALVAAKWLAVVAMFALGAYLAHVAGIHLADAQSGGLRDRVEDLTARLDAVERERERLARELAAASARAEELRKRYESDVPSGAISDLLRALRERLAAGVKPERLAAVVALADNARRCDDKPVAKRQRRRRLRRSSDPGQRLRRQRARRRRPRRDLVRSVEARDRYLRAPRRRRDDGDRRAAAAAFGGAEGRRVPVPDHRRRRPQLRHRDRRCLRLSLSAVAPGSRRQSCTRITASISTDMLLGSEPMPTAERA